MSNSPNSALPPPATSAPGQSRGYRWGLVIVVAAVLVLLAVYRSSLSAENLIAREAEFRATYVQHPITVLAIAFLLYVAMTALSIPGASLLTLASGWLFGFWPALVLVSFASSLGATMACGLSRTLFREIATRQLGNRLQVIEESLDRDGDFYLLTLRLLPQVPFFLVNLALGLTRYPLWRFYWISQLGMLPATCVFVYAGAQAVDLKTLIEKGPGSLLTPNLILALCLLAFLPWILRSLVRWVRPHSQLPKPVLPSNPLGSDSAINYSDQKSGDTGGVIPLSVADPLTNDEERRGSVSPPQ